MISQVVLSSQEENTQVKNDQSGSTVITGGEHSGKERSVR